MKQIEAYYREETDAETARAKIDTLKVQEVTVEEVTRDNNKIAHFFRDLFDPNEGTEDHHSPHLLHFEVDESDYAEALALVKGSPGYISTED